jgi:ferredoxin
MDAVHVTNEEAAEVDASSCIGCGVCAPGCAAEAIDLILRAEVKPPPNLAEFLTARYKEH